jgi:hypothetical protein
MDESTENAGETSRAATRGSLFNNATGWTTKRPQGTESVEYDVYHSNGQFGRATRQVLLWIDAVCIVFKYGESGREPCESTSVSGAGQGDYLYLSKELPAGYPKVHNPGYWNQYGLASGGAMDLAARRPALSKNEIFCFSRSLVSASSGRKQVTEPGLVKYFRAVPRRLVEATSIDWRRSLPCGIGAWVHHR